MTLRPAFESKLIPGLPEPVRGKVRDIYPVGNDRLMLVSSDRISAFDWVLPTPIPDKGRVLNLFSAFWFYKLGVSNHSITTDVDQMPFPDGFDKEPFRDRSMLVQKLEVVLIECVVRRYLTGSAWKEYQIDGTVCGILLPPGLFEGARLPEPIFTPATKETTGHDVNISFERMCQLIGPELAEELRAKSVTIFLSGERYALNRDFILVDTKFEWGRRNGDSILIDEVLTPDSSRYWLACDYQPGTIPASFDKQYVRDYLINVARWDKKSPPPALPDDVVAKTREKYIEAYERLTGIAFTWK